jgi:hypothetical protein
MPRCLQPCRRRPLRRAMPRCLQPCRRRALPGGRALAYDRLSRLGVDRLSFLSKSGQVQLSASLLLKAAPRPELRSEPQRRASAKPAQPNGEDRFRATGVLRKAPRQASGLFEAAARSARGPAGRRAKVAPQFRTGLFSQKPLLACFASWATLPPASLPRFFCRGYLG